MKIKIPRFIRVLDKKVKIQLVKGLMANEHVLGRALIDDHIIKIDADQDRQEMTSTYMHELIEYCFSVAGCYFSRPDREHQYLIDHSDVEKIACMIKQAFESAEY